MPEDNMTSPETTLIKPPHQVEAAQKAVYEQYLAREREREFRRLQTSQVRMFSRAELVSGVKLETLDGHPGDFNKRWVQVVEIYEKGQLKAALPVGDSTLGPGEDLRLVGPSGKIYRVEEDLTRIDHAPHVEKPEGAQSLSTDIGMVLTVNQDGFVEVDAEEREEGISVRMKKVDVNTPAEHLKSVVQVMDQAYEDPRNSALAADRIAHIQEAEREMFGRMGNKTGSGR